MGLGRIGRYVMALSMAGNQLVNAASGGSAYETVSSRIGHAREHGSKVGAGMCHLFDWIDPRDGDSPCGDHCTIAERNHDIGRHKWHCPGRDDNADSSTSTP